MDDIFAKIEAHTQQARVRPWVGTFRDYLPLVLAQPRLAQLAHARLYEMVRTAGVDVDEQGQEHYAFFARELFGIDEALAKVVEYLKAAALGSDVGKRILMLYGPPSSGKSQLVILLKRGLEAYTHTEAGAVYAIADCPQHENPLHLIPQSLRAELLDTYGVYIEGELCPLCALHVRDTYEGDIYRVPVRRIVFSEKDRRGIGTMIMRSCSASDLGSARKAVNSASLVCARTHSSA
jgi:serine protein kinase